ncbi:MAG TPA: helix-turn-helix domain-containing protein [Thiolinea sp.]|nr:helix-turn-helix domain-containing protein [Thiolinea sp.]
MNTDENLLIISQQLEKTAYEAAKALIDADHRSIWHHLRSCAERGILRAALEHNGGNQSASAEMLHVNRATLRTRLGHFSMLSAPRLIP